MAQFDYLVKTSSGPLNVRSGPGLNSRKVGSLKTDTRVTVKASKVPWKQLDSGSWVHGKYLTPATTGPNTGSVITQLMGIIPDTVTSLDGQQIPLPKELIKKIHLRSKITVSPYLNGNTYQVAISHPTWSGDARMLMSAFVGGLGVGSANAYGNKTLGYAAKKALGFALKGALHAVTAVVSPNRTSPSQRVLELKEGDLVVYYFVTR